MPYLPMFPKLQALRHFTNVLRDTTRTDSVFKLVETLSRDPKVIAKFPPKPAEQAFRAAPFQQGFPELDALRAMAEGSLGRALSVHMDELGVDFGEFDRSADPQNPLEWTERHAYETHDIWHALTGWRTGTANELGLQGFYAAQLGSIPAATLVLLGIARGVMGGHEDFSAAFEAISAGWIQGRRAKALFGVDWRPHFPKPLAEVRERFELEAIDGGAFIEIADQLAA